MAQNNKNLLLGAASMAAGIIRTLTSTFLPRKKTWPEKAKDAATNLAKQTANMAQSAASRFNKKLLLGTVAGGLIGVTAALLLAPKAGNELLEGFYKSSKVDHKRVKTKARAVKKTMAKASPEKNIHPEAADVVKKVKKTAKKTVKLAS